MIGLPGSPKGHLPRKNQAAVSEVGGCVVCREGIFSNQEWGRAPKPLLGKAHKDCGGRS